MRTMVMVFGCMALLASLNGIPADAASKARNISKEGRPLKARELYRMYGDKSWIWEKGVGYFARSKRRFTSVISVKKQEYAVGNWYIPGNGKVCFRAFWYAGKTRTRAVTCFSHRLVDGRIYQKREPKGEWYVFRNNPGRMMDEYRKFRRGDYVAHRLEKASR